MLFEETREQEDVFVVPHGRLADLRQLVDQFSIIERLTLRAIVVEPGKTVSPWAATDVESALRRIDTDWITRAMTPASIGFHYQPVVDARTLRIHGNEALVRCSVDGHAIRPDELVGAAKAHDALLALDQIMRREAILKTADALRQSQELLFINFIPLTVYDPEVCLRTTFRAAQSSGINFNRLVFEVVESETFPDIAHLRRILDRYREVGAAVALDDLGAGNTALLYIDEIEPEYVKIDRELLRRAVASGHSALFVGLVRHAQDRGIRVIAEGIETEQELDFCLKLGVDFAQGYYIAKPSPEFRTGGLVQAKNAA